MNEKIDLEFYKRELEIVWSPVNSRRVDHIRQFELIKFLYRNFPENVPPSILINKFSFSNNRAVYDLAVSANNCVGERFPYLIQFQRGKGYMLRIKTKAEDERRGGGRKKTLIVW